MPYSGQVKLISTEVDEGDYDIVIPFMTDIHYCPFRDLKWHGNIENENIKRLEPFIEMTNSLDPTLTVYGGDYSSDWNTMEVMRKAMRELYKEMEKAKGRKVYICGNHDFGDAYNYGKEGENRPMSNEEFNKLFGSKGSKEMYFYYDVLDKKTRIVIMNTSDSYILTPNGHQKYNRCVDETSNVIGRDQVKWLVDEALNTPEENWKIILMGHVPLRDNLHNGKAVAQILDARNNNQVISVRDTDPNEDFNVEMDIDFTKYKGCEIVGYISGHTHYDQSVKYHNINVLSTTLAKGDDRYKNIPINLSTTTFDVYCFKLFKREIHVYRFGKGIPRIIKW